MMIQGMIELADQIKAMRDEGIEHHLILDEVTGRLTEMAGHAMAQKITDPAPESRGGAVTLDWKRHAMGPLMPCRLCGQGALMRDEHGRPCHKVCAEKEAS